MDRRSRSRPNASEATRRRPHGAQVGIWPHPPCVVVRHWVDALRRGFQGRIVTGPLQILAWPTLIAIGQRGWLARRRRPTGFIFQDDVLLATMVHAIAHPILDIRQFIDGWNATCFLTPDTPIPSILASHFDFLHPLKNSSWAHQVRAALPLPSPGEEFPRRD